MIENKMYLLAVDLIKKRYPKGWGETADDAIIRELKEETGIVYDANNLKELLLLEYYQLNYPTRRDEVINRLIRTKFYFGQYRGIDLKSINRTENEVKDNFIPVFHKYVSSVTEDDSIYVVYDENHDRGEEKIHRLRKCIQKVRL